MDVSAFLRDVVADCLLRGHTSLYDYAGRFASYDYRRPLLFSQLAGFNADILVLQEMVRSSNQLVSQSALSLC
eukprot:m.204243 g.204243  ORF g.204243 m.204243 type:complete len:73 (+) comp53862_c0_seq6:2739-2957(+)